MHCSDGRTVLRWRLANIVYCVWQQCLDAQGSCSQSTASRMIHIEFNVPSRASGMPLGNLTAAAP